MSASIRTRVSWVKPNVADARESALAAGLGWPLAAELSHAPAERLGIGSVGLHHVASFVHFRQPLAGESPVRFTLLDVEREGDAAQLGRTFRVTRKKLAAFEGTRGALAVLWSPAITSDLDGVELLTSGGWCQVESRRRLE